MLDSQKLQERLQSQIGALVMQVLAQQLELEELRGIVAAYAKHVDPSSEPK